MAINESKSDYSDFFEDVTYTPYGGTSKTIDAVVDTDFANQQDYDRGTRFATAVIYVHNTDVTDPSGRDTYTFNGKTWDIGEDGYQASGDFYTVNLVRLLT